MTIIRYDEREFRYFTKEMTSPKFWPASPRCATGQLFYGPEVAAMHQPSFQHLPRCNQLLYVQEHDLYLERGGFRNLVLTWDFVRKGQYGQEISKSWRCQNLLNPNPQNLVDLSVNLTRDKRCGKLYQSLYHQSIIEIFIEYYCQILELTL